jgi:hypothetical protein
MSIATRATDDARTMTDVELTELRDRDTPDARLMLTVDSAGRQFTNSSPVPIYSCVNVAMQTDDDDCRSRWSFTDCLKRALMQRLALIVGGILIVITIILLERFLGMELFDEKKLIQDITTELLPQLKSGYNTTPTAAVQ